jgi:hypothetical protein
MATESDVAASFMAIVFSFFRQKKLKKDLNGSWGQPRG